MLEIISCKNIKIINDKYNPDTNHCRDSISQDLHVHGDLHWDTLTSSLKSRIKYVYGWVLYSVFINDVIVTSTHTSKLVT